MRGRPSPAPPPLRTVFFLQRPSFAPLPPPERGRPSPAPPPARIVFFPPTTLSRQPFPFPYVAAPCSPSSPFSPFLSANVPLSPPIPPPCGPTPASTAAADVFGLPRTVSWVCLPGRRGHPRSPSPAAFRPSDHATLPSALKMWDGGMRCFTLNQLARVSRADGADEGGSSFRGSFRLQVGDGRTRAPLGAHGVRSPSWVLPCLAQRRWWGGGDFLEGKGGSTTGFPHTRAGLSVTSSSLSTGRRQGAESPPMRVACFDASALKSTWGEEGGCIAGDAGCAPCGCFPPLR